MFSVCLLVNIGVLEGVEGGPPAELVLVRFQQVRDRVYKRQTRLLYANVSAVVNR